MVACVSTLSSRGAAKRFASPSVIHGVKSVLGASMEPRRTTLQKGMGGWPLVVTVCLALLFLAVSPPPGALAGEIQPLDVQEVADGFVATYSETTRLVAVEVAQGEARILATTVKPRPFREVLGATDTLAGSRDVWLELVLMNGSGDTFTVRRAVQGLCLEHDSKSEAHVEGDLIWLHRDAIQIELPDLPGLGMLEVAYLGTGEAPTGTREMLGVLELPGQSEEAEEALFKETTSTVYWPEDYGDTVRYLVAGNEIEVPQRVNVVVVPDGYTYAEKTLMESHFNELVAQLRTKTPIAEHARFFNFILVYAYSGESGTDQCDCPGIGAVNTPMNTGFPRIVDECGNSENRGLYYGQHEGSCDDDSIVNLVTAEQRAPAVDTTVIMVNTTRYGGAGGSRAVYSAGNYPPSSAAQIAIHELGHSFAHLADEYSVYDDCGSGAIEVNTSTNPTDGAWPEWIEDIGPPCEGGQYYRYCIYRPRSTCAMRSHTQPFCEVCSQRWALKIFEHFRVSSTAPIAAMSPASPVPVDVGGHVFFSVTPRLAEGQGVTNSFIWTRRGPGDPEPVVLPASGESLDQVFTEPGLFEVTCELTADTNFIKPEKVDRNRDTVTWAVCSGACPELSITQPDENTVWTTGHQIRISWTHSGPTSDYLKVEFDNHPSEPWETLYEHAWLFDGGVDWFVLGEPSNYARVRISDVGDPRISDVSPFFSIVDNPAFRVQQPNGGEYLLIGSWQDLLWETAGEIDAVDVSLSRNGGGSWEILFDDLPMGSGGGGGGGDGESGSASVEWQITPPCSVDALLRVCDSNDGSNCDVSDSRFFIGDSSSIELTSPNGGELWAIGGTRQIGWDPSGLSGPVQIELSRNGGLTWELLFAEVSNTGSHDWVVTEPATEQARVRVTSVGCVAVSDVGGLFSIVDVGDTYVVRKTSDEPDIDPTDGLCLTAAGGCTLRAAIEQANAWPGLQSIHFGVKVIPPFTNIPTIRPATPLPSVTDPVVIDGTTQPTYGLVVVSGTQAGEDDDGLRITGGGSTVRGLVVNRFRNGIVLASGSHNRVQGSRIGTSPDGLSALGNRESGILISNSAGNLIGGGSDGAGNLISGNSGSGITIAHGGSVSNILLGNLVGTDVTGTNPLGNQGDGVTIIGSSSNRIGTRRLDDSEGNTIAYNGGSGVVVQSGEDNAIAGGPIALNEALAIDLGRDGVTPNDPGDVDEGPNHLLNFPEIESAVCKNGEMEVSGTLAVDPAGPTRRYYVHVFVSNSCDESGFGQGGKLIGVAAVTVDEGGLAKFTVTGECGQLPESAVVTATSTAFTTTNWKVNLLSTSEFSACEPVN